MSIRLSKAFGSSAEVWLGLQMDYDLAQAEKNAHRIKVERVRHKQLALQSSGEVTYSVIDRLYLLAREKPVFSACE